MSDKDKLERKGHDDREDLTGEHKFGDLGQIILFVLFVIVWVVDSFIYQPLGSYGYIISPIIRYSVGAIILIIGLLLARKSLNMIFGEASKDMEIVDIGPFGLVRHPVYLSAMIFYFGLFVGTISIVSLITLIIIVVFYHYIASYEEKLLKERFGEKYKSYQSHVPMWLPFTKRK